MKALFRVLRRFRAKKGSPGGAFRVLFLVFSHLSLQNGLPLDMDVYDLAASCAVAELSERSVRARGAPQDVPDFTRGAWKDARPVEITPVGLARMGFKSDSELKGDSSQLSV